MPSWLARTAAVYAPIAMNPAFASESSPVASVR